MGYCRSRLAINLRPAPSLERQIGSLQQHLRRSLHHVAWVDALVICLMGMQPSRRPRRPCRRSQSLRQDGGAGSRSTGLLPQGRNGRHFRELHEILRFQPEYLGIMIRAGVFGGFRRTPSVETRIAAEHGPNACNRRNAACPCRCRPASGANWERRRCHRITHVLRALISGSNLVRHTSVCSGVSRTSP